MIFKKAFVALVLVLISYSTAEMIISHYKEYTAITVVQGSKSQFYKNTSLNYISSFSDEIDRFENDPITSIKNITWKTYDSNKGAVSAAGAASFFGSAGIAMLGGAFALPLAYIPLALGVGADLYCYKKIDSELNQYIAPSVYDRKVENLYIYKLCLWGALLLMYSLIFKYLFFLKVNILIDEA